MTEFDLSGLASQRKAQTRFGANEDHKRPAPAKRVGAITSRPSHPALGSAMCY